MTYLEYYTQQFYKKHYGSSLSAANAVVPMLLRYFSVSSVVDVGCGIGIWLSVFRDKGIPKILGLDGPHVNKELLTIREDEFVAVDLRTEFCFPTKYDLAVSLEVAEHLPEDRAKSFVRQLTEMSNVIIFSAGIPGQPGEGHINLRWQDYWRSLFEDDDYAAIDLIRPQIWGRDDIPYWYQQNTILYCHRSIIDIRTDLKPTGNNTSLNIVHPELYDYIRQCYERRIAQVSEVSLRKSLNMLPALTVSALRRRLFRMGGGKI